MLTHNAQQRVWPVLPADVCLNVSLFFFLHFQGLNRRPKVANLLRRRIGGVWVPGTSESERIDASRSTSSAGRHQGDEQAFTSINILIQDLMKQTFCLAETQQANKRDL